MIHKRNWGGLPSSSSSSSSLPLPLSSSSFSSSSSPRRSSLCRLILFLLILLAISFILLLSAQYRFIFSDRFLNTEIESPELPTLFIPSTPLSPPHSSPSPHTNSNSNAFTYFPWNHSLSLSPPSHSLNLQFPPPLYVNHQSLLTTPSPSSPFTPPYSAAFLYLISPYEVHVKELNTSLFSLIERFSQYYSYYPIYLLFDEKEMEGKEGVLRSIEKNIIKPILNKYNEKIQNHSLSLTPPLSIYFVPLSLDFPSSFSRPLHSSHPLSSYRNELSDRRPWGYAHMISLWNYLIFTDKIASASASSTSSKLSPLSSLDYYIRLDTDSELLGERWKIDPFLYFYYHSEMQNNQNNKNEDANNINELVVRYGYHSGNIDGQEWVKGLVLYTFAFYIEEVILRDLLRKSIQQDPNRNVLISEEQTLIVDKLFQKVKFSYLESVRRRERKFKQNPNNQNLSITDVMDSIYGYPTHIPHIFFPYPITQLYFHSPATYHHLLSVFMRRGREWKGEEKREKMGEKDTWRELMKEWEKEKKKRVGEAEREEGSEGGGGRREREVSSIGVTVKRRRSLIDKEELMLERMKIERKVSSQMVSEAIENIPIRPTSSSPYSESYHFTPFFSSIFSTTFYPYDTLLSHYPSNDLFLSPFLSRLLHIPVPIFYNNFELMDMKYMRDNEEMRRYLSHIHENLFVYLHRWGDAPIRFLITAMGGMGGGEKFDEHGNAYGNGNGKDIHVNSAYDYTVCLQFEYKHDRVMKGLALHEFPLFGEI